MVNKIPGQAGMPRGLIGRLLGKIMVSHNRPDNEWTIDLLQTGSYERILEVGFGPGMAIESLMKSYPNIHVDGIDHSETMLRAASVRNQEAVAAGLVTLQLGSVEKLPFAASTFNKALAVNCIYFWEKPVQGLTELHRVLKPGGRLGITVRDKTRDAYQAFRPERLKEMFAQAGFTAVEVVNNGVPSHPLICALGTK
jgi:SAM-dependent methyltransferase